MSGLATPLDDRAARAWLSANLEPGLPAAAALVAAVGPAEAVRALAAGRTVPGSPAAPDPDPAGTAASVLRAAAERGVGLVCPGDDEWPAALDDLATTEPLHGRGGLPVALWVRGDTTGLAARCAGAVAVVGARASTAYGDDVAGGLGAGLAETGTTVVSGAAHGIDAAAHRGALAVGGTTVAVLACGADVVYPRGHEALLGQVVRSGVVVSEAPPGARPTKVRFLARNRLIAALSRAVVVVEAAWRSGALNTLSWGDALHRLCFGVPGPVTSLTSAGVHLVLRERKADLVTCTADVREALSDLGSAPLPGATTWGRGEVRATDLLDPETMRVLELLPAGAPLATAVVAGALRLEVEQVLRVLRRLVAIGLAEEVGDGWRALPRRAALPGAGRGRTLR